VLIVKLSAIGDVLYALPFSAALGEAFPHLKLTWIVEDRAAPLLVGNPYLHDVIVVPSDWYRRPLAFATWQRFFALRRRLRARRFELVIDLQALSRSALVALAAGAPHRYGYDWLREVAPLFLTRVPRRPDSIHIVDQLLDVARFFGAPVREAQFPLHIPDEDEARALELLDSVGIDPSEPFLVMNPTGDAFHKGWGAARYVALLDELAREESPPVVLMGGPEDRRVGGAIRAAAGRPPASLIGRTTLMQLAAVLRRAAVHLSGDTGSAHLAAVLGTPTVCIFGRNNPVRVAPYGRAGVVLHHREQCAAVCRRYHERAPLNSNQDCLAQPPACLAAVGVAEVARALRGCLARTAPCAGALSPAPVPAVHKVSRSGR
jgi:heptosyltransferase-1